MTLLGRISELITAIGTDIKALFGRVIPSGGTTGQVLAKSSNTDYAVGWVSPSGGGSLTIYPATISVAGVACDYIGTVTNASVTATSKIILQHGIYTEDDENEDEIEDIKSIEIESVSTGSFQIRMTTIGPVVGDFKFFYILA